MTSVYTAAETLATYDPYDKSKIKHDTVAYHGFPINLYCRAVYRFGCGAVESSSWWNSRIFWVKMKYAFGGIFYLFLIFIISLYIYVYVISVDMI